MTDFDAASATYCRRGLKNVGLVALLALTLGGCETGSSVFGGASTPSAELAQSTAPAAPAATKYLARVGLAPIIGAPEAVSKQLGQQLTDAGERQRISMQADREAKTDYMLRGYIVASRDKAGTKLAYIWDLTDASGRRVNRVTGEEVVPGTPGSKDPWAAISPTVTQTVADKTATSLATWLATQPAPQAAPAVASATTQPPAAVGAGDAAGKAGSAQPVAAAAQASGTATASLPPNDGVVAAVPVVTGAPGNGNTALAAALQQELTRQGVSLASKPNSAYRVEGNVILGKAQDGKQPIQIDWKVKDPQGKALGTVSQKNEIPPGSLDGDWGKTADAAAAAAAQGIVKLLPQAKQTN